MTLSTVIGLLRSALFGWQGRGLLTALVMQSICNRLVVVAARLERMAARFAAGCAMTRVTSARVATGVRSGAGARPVARYWPVRFGWLLVERQHHAAWFTNSVDRILREPEMVGLLEASEEARRLLRPMCRMLGVDLALLRRPVAVGVAAARTSTRVRAKKPPLDVGRVPLPRGVATWVRREKRLGRFDFGG